ncbi:hypothetical protein V8E52_009329 [Russula decolorans]|jgi:hypothetical protein
MWNQKSLLFPFTHPYVFFFLSATLLVEPLSALSRLASCVFALPNPLPLFSPLIIFPPSFVRMTPTPAAPSLATAVSQRVEVNGGSSSSTPTTETSEGEHGFERVTYLLIPGASINLHPESDSHTLSSSQSAVQSTLPRWDH